MNDTLSIDLPGGLWAEGTCIREATLRTLTGADEAFLLESGTLVFPSQRTTALLARCITRLGPLHSISADTFRLLTVGDREALLLHLRRLLLGDHIECIVTCPMPECGEKMDLALQVSNLLLSPYPHYKEHYTEMVSDAGMTFTVQFRLPNGSDQESVAPLAGRDPQTAAETILRRCIEQITTEDGSTVNGIPPAVINRLPSIISELDPQAELNLDLKCPYCGHSFSTIFDTGSFFYEELDKRMKSLYREVHLLAFYYHWSEAEIMGMTHRKRERYLVLLTEAVTEMRKR